MQTISGFICPSQMQLERVFLALSWSYSLNLKILSYNSFIVDHPPLSSSLVGVTHPLTIATLLCSKLNGSVKTLLSCSLRIPVEFVIEIADGVVVGKEWSKSCVCFLSVTCASVQHFSGRPIWYRSFYAAPRYGAIQVVQEFLSYFSSYHPSRINGQVFW